MSRRSSFFEDVARLPWPVGVGLAAAAFVGFQIAASSPPGGMIGQAMVPMFRTLGWVLPMIFLIAAFLSFLTQVFRGRRFKATRSIADIRSLSWKQFESFIGELFRQQGYFVVETPEGPDNGVDLVLRKDGEKAYVQCKHWKTNQVGVEKVRELLGSMAAGGAQSGIFVTSGSYTQAARNFARECGIQLIDGEQLAESLARELPVNSTSVSQAQTEVAPSCPVCHAPMVKRVAQRGENKGNPFWGCSKYPACRGIRNVQI
jgi:restriction system protein